MYLKASDALTDEGNANYYVDVLYNNSTYIYWLDHPAVGAGTAWGTTVSGCFICCSNNVYC